MTEQLHRGARCLALVLMAAVGIAESAVAQSQSAAGSAAALIDELGLIEADRPVREMPGWRIPKKIIVGGGMDIAELRAVAPNVKFLTLRDSDAELAEADAVIGTCSAGLLARATQVRWIQLTNVGAENCVSVPAVKARQPLLTNMQRVQAGTIGEHAIALSFALARNLGGHLANQARAQWGGGGAEASMRSLTGKTLLVVGLGGIGTEVAKRASALGMKVTATRASGKRGPEFVSYVGRPDELLNLAKDADIIVNAAPLTAETTHLFNAKFFSVVKPTAYFVNVARGRSVVTADLVAALNEKRLAGAAMDVTDPEPLPPEHPLWRMTNVILTPHVSDNSDLPRDKVGAVVRENLRRYVAGEKMLSVVGIERGY